MNVHAGAPSLCTFLNDIHVFNNIFISLFSMFAKRIVTAIKQLYLFYNNYEPSYTSYINTAR